MGAAATGCTCATCLPGSATEPSRPAGVLASVLADLRQKSLCDCDHVFTISLHEANSGPSIQDVVRVQCAFVGDGILEFGSGDIDSISHRVSWTVTCR